MVQPTSRVLKQEVVFDNSNVTSLDWVSNPVLRFPEHPDVVPVLVQRLEEPSTRLGRR
jgi:nicotinate dehydrogenase subunit B